MTATETVSGQTATYNFRVTVAQCPAIVDIYIDSMITSFVANENGLNANQNLLSAGGQVSPTVSGAVVSYPTDCLGTLAYWILKGSNTAANPFGYQTSSCD